MEPIVIVGCDG